MRLAGMSLRELVAAYNEAAGLRGKAQLKASAFKNKQDAMKRIRAVSRRKAGGSAAGEGTIRALAESLLKTPKPYSDIQQLIRKKFPDCATSSSSLRWYAAQMRKRGEKVAERPLDTHA